MSRHARRNSANGKRPKTKLALPDLDHCKSAVLKAKDRKGMSCAAHVYAPAGVGAVVHAVSRLRTWAAARCVDRSVWKCGFAGHRRSWSAMSYRMGL